MKGDLNVARVGDGEAGFEDYLAAVRAGLGPLGEGEREDIVRELATHLEEGLRRGEALDAVIARMGEPMVLASAMLQERLVTVERRRSPLEMLRILLAAVSKPFLITMVILVGLSTLNTWYLFTGVMRATDSWLLPLALYYLPAILVICLPMATLAVGLFGLPRLSSELSRGMFRSALPGLVAAILLGSLLPAGLGIVLNDTLLPAANRASVDFLREQLRQPGQDLPQPPRSIQELTRAEVQARLAEETAKRARLLASKANYTDVAQADEALRLITWLGALKVSVPALSFGMGALGLALGLFLTRFRPVRGLTVGLWIVTSSGVFALLQWGQVSGLPGVVAAWLPFGCTLVLAVVITLIDRLLPIRGDHAEAC